MPIPCKIFTPSLCLVATGLIILLLAGCAAKTFKGDAHLYPVNDSARSTGLLTAHFVTDGMGHGTTDLVMPSGEDLKGEFSYVEHGTTNFGGVFGAVWGAHGLTPVIGTSTSGQVERTSEGQSAAYGNKGTEMLCEFLRDNYTGHGYGGCKDNLGNLYREQF